jgi:hypothetical protein
LEEEMDVVERSHAFLKKTSKFWHISITFLSSLKLQDKVEEGRPTRCVNNDEDKTFVAWVWVCKI